MRKTMRRECGENADAQTDRGVNRKVLRYRMDGLGSRWVGVVVAVITALVN